MWDFLEMRPLTALLTAAVFTLGWSAVPVHGGERVVILLNGVEPPMLQATMGTRVEFENRTGRAVHLEFEGDGRQHEVVQAPATGPFWVIFHLPGTHRYAVHVYEAKERTLRGVVEVVEDPRRSGEAPACSVAVMGVCVER